MDFAVGDSARLTGAYYATFSSSCRAIRLDADSLGRRAETRTGHVAGRGRARRSILCTDVCNAARAIG